jgi:hypothetical protein
LRYAKLTISMAKCKGLALVTLARIEKWQREFKGASESCDTQCGTKLSCMLRIILILL